jgi:hypothetical protein
MRSQHSLRKFPETQDGVGNTSASLGEKFARAGLTIFRSRHMAIHPAAEAIVVRGDSQNYMVPHDVLVHHHDNS